MLPKGRQARGQHQNSRGAENVPGARGLRCENNILTQDVRFMLKCACKCTKLPYFENFQQNGPFFLNRAEHDHFLFRPDHGNSLAQWLITKSPVLCKNGKLCVVTLIWQRKTCRNRYGSLPYLGTLLSSKRCRWYKCSQLYFHACLTPISDIAFCNLRYWGNKGCWD